MKYSRIGVVATFLVVGTVAFFFDWNVSSFIAAALVAAAFQVGDAWIGKAAVEGNAAVLKNETLLQAQAYIAFLESQVNENMEKNGYQTQAPSEEG